MTLDEYLAVPYVVTMVAVRGPGGEWMRRAEYPELSGCRGHGLSPEEALEDLEHNRQRIIRERFANGERIPVPRRPLQRLARSTTGH